MLPNSDADPAIGPAISLNERPSARATILEALAAPTVSPCRAALSAAGQVVITPDGKPLRSIVTGRRHIVTGAYASRKARRTLTHESMNELHFFMHSEVDTRVVDYLAQPIRFEFVLDGQKFIQILDCIRLLAGGTLQAVEIKKDFLALRDPAYASKLDCVAHLCGLLGWQFNLVTQRDLDHRGTLFKNIRYVQQRRTVAYRDRHIYAAREGLARQGGVAPLGWLAEQLGDRRAGIALIQSMMVGRVLQIGLHEPLGPETPVTPARAGLAPFSVEEEPQ